MYCNTASSLLNILMNYVHTPNILIVWEIPAGVPDSQSLNTSLIILFCDIPHYLIQYKILTVVISFWSIKIL